MNGERMTGVTLQTLDEKSFDHGIMLAQKSFLIPNYNTCTYSELLKFISPQAAGILVEGIRDQLYAPPLVDICQSISANLPSKLSYAPKISKKDHQLEWQKPDAFNSIPRKHRALGRMWSNIYIDDKATKRLIFEDFQQVTRQDILSNLVTLDLHDQGTKLRHLTNPSSQIINPLLQPLYFILEQQSDGSKSPLHFAIDGDTVLFLLTDGILRVKEITVEGQTKKPAARVMRDIRGYWKNGISHENPSDALERSVAAIIV
jgi:methionyl-tRNA formyltransferase